MAGLVPAIHDFVARQQDVDARHQAGHDGRREETMAEIRVPTLGESVTEATIGKWFKKPGDPVAVDEPLVELETDKVTIEVPAPAAGTLGDIAAKDGDTVPYLGRIESIRRKDGHWVVVTSKGVITSVR